MIQSEKPFAAFAVRLYEAGRPDARCRDLIVCHEMTIENDMLKVYS